MKYKWIIAIAILWLGNMKSQSCDGFNKNTFQHTTSAWDWRDGSDANYMARLDLGQSTPTTRSIASPFEPSSIGQPNTQHLFLAQGKRDYEPSEGWELVYKDFGFTSTNGLTNPHFILYNRFRGILRVFYCLTGKHPGYSSSTIFVEWNGGKVSTLLETGKSSMRASKLFSKEITLEIPNRLPNNEAFIWQFADIPVNYDPCACNNSMDGLGSITPNVSSFLFGVKFYKTSTHRLEMNQVLPGQTNFIVAGNYEKSNNTDIISNIANFLTKNIVGPMSMGNKLDKNISSSTKTVEDGLKAILDISNFFKSRDTNVIRTKEVKLPGIVKALPKFGFAIGFIESFLGGGKVENPNNTSNSAVPQKFAISGTSDLTGWLTSKSIYTPGSPHGSITGQDVIKPVYNYVLGTFGLLEEPKLEAIMYWIGANSAANRYAGGYAEPPRIIKYRLKEPIKYAINPASELEVIDVQTAIEYKCLPNKDGSRLAYQAGLDTNQNFTLRASNPKGQWFNIFLPAVGPVKTKKVNPSYSYRQVCEANGIYIANWPAVNENVGDPNGNASLYNITFSTGFHNPSCYEKFNFAIADYPKYFGHFQTSNFGSQYLTIEKPDYSKYLNFSGENLRVVLKVKIILRRKDKYVNSTTEDIVKILSYDITTPTGLGFDDPNFGYNKGPKFFYDFDPYITTSGRFGVDYSIDSFGVSSLVGDRPLGTAAYPEDLEITSWTPQNKDVIIYATRKIVVKTRIYNNPPYKVILRGGSGVEIADGGSIDANSVDTDINSDFPGCEGFYEPATYSYIQNYCSDTSKYYVVFNKMATAPPPSKSKSDFLTTLTLHPNPSTSLTTLTIENPSAEQARVMVYDLVGREVYSQDMKDVSESNNKLEISTDGWQTGLYIVKVIHGEVEKSIKLEVR